MTRRYFSRLVDVVGTSFQMVSRRRLIFNAGFFFSDQLISGIFRFVSFAYLARVYGPSDTGRWSYVLAVFTLVAPLCASGIEPVTIQTLLGNLTRRREVLASTAVFVAITTLFALAGSQLWLHFSGADATVIALGEIFCIAYLPNFLLVIDHALKADLHAKTVVGVHIAAAAGGAILRVFLTAMHVPITYVAISTVVELWIAAFGLLFFCPGVGCRFLRHVRWDFIKLITRLGFPLIVSGLMVTLFFRLNLIILGKMSSYAEVGKFAVVSTIAQMLVLAPSAVSTALYPKFVELKNSDQFRFERMSRWQIYGFTVMGYVMLAILAGLAPLLPAIFGLKYQGSQLVLLILAVSMIASCGGIGRAMLINVTGNTHYHLISAGVGVAFLVASGLLLIPKYGAVGAAWAQLFGSFASSYLTSPALSGMRQFSLDQFRALLLLPPRK